MSKIIEFITYLFTITFRFVIEQYFSIIIINGVALLRMTMQILDRKLHFKKVIFYMLLFNIGIVVLAISLPNSPYYIRKTYPVQPQENEIIIPNIFNLEKSLSLDVDMRYAKEKYNYIGNRWGEYGIFNVVSSIDISTISIIENDYQVIRYIIISKKINKDFKKYDSIVSYVNDVINNEYGNFIKRDTITYREEWAKIQTKKIKDTWIADKYKIDFKYITEEKEYDKSYFAQLFRIEYSLLSKDTK